MSSATIPDALFWVERRWSEFCEWQTRFALFEGLAWITDSRGYAANLFYLDGDQSRKGVVFLDAMGGYSLWMVRQLIEEQYAERTKDYRLAKKAYQALNAALAALARGEGESNGK